VQAPSLILLTGMHHASGAPVTRDQRCIGQHIPSVSEWQLTPHRRESLASRWLSAMPLSHPSSRGRAGAACGTRAAQPTPNSRGEFRGSVPSGSVARQRGGWCAAATPKRPRSIAADPTVADPTELVAACGMFRRATRLDPVVAPYRPDASLRSDNLAW